MATDQKDHSSASASASASSSASASASAAVGATVGFEDYLPWMAERLGEEGLMEELCKGFRLLMDQQSGLITFESLKRNAAALGLGQLGDEELMGMVLEGDVDGDGALDQMEFCVLMLRLSPQLMDDYSQKLFLGQAFNC